MGCRVRCQSGGGGGGFTQEQIEDFIGAMIVAGAQTGITVTYDDAGNAIDFSTWTTEQIQDLVGTMAAGGTQSGITVTYDDAGGFLDFSVSGTWTTEQLQDLVGAMATGGTQTAISVTYDDASGTLDFVVTPGAFDIDSFPDATTPLSAADLFVVSQGGVEGKVAWSDVNTGGGGSSDPYGLLTTPGGWEWGDEFDDGVIDPAWDEIIPGSGTASWVEGFHRLSIIGDAVSDTDNAVQVRPIGTAWAINTILEAEIGFGPFGGGAQRGVLQVSDGNLAGSNAVGLMVTNSGTSAVFYTVRGTLGSSFGTSFNGPHGAFNDRVRMRVVANTADEIGFWFSTDGNNWISLKDWQPAAVYSIATLGWTPTHVALNWSQQGNGAQEEMSADYVRRFA